MKRWKGEKGLKKSFIFRWWNGCQAVKTKVAFWELRWRAEKEKWAQARGKEHSDSGKKHKTNTKWINFKKSSIRAEIQETLNSKPMKWQSKKDSHEKTRTIKKIRSKEEIVSEWLWDGEAVALGRVRGSDAFTNGKEQISAARANQTPVLPGALFDHYSKHTHIREAHAMHSLRGSTLVLNKQLIHTHMHTVTQVSWWHDTVSGQCLVGSSSTAGPVTSYSCHPSTHTVAHACNVHHTWEKSAIPITLELTLISVYIHTVAALLRLDYKTTLELFNANHLK